MAEDRSGSAIRSGRAGPDALLHRGEAVLIGTVALVLTAVSLAWSYAIKARCSGPPFDADGRSLNFPSGDPRAIIPCYTDLQVLWIDRGLYGHTFPYIHGGITDQGQLFGGTVEYPVLSGVIIWLGSLGRHTDLGYLQQSALILSVFALITTALLAWMARWWVLLWAATPPLLLYAFHNWELPVVATAVAAIAVLAWGESADPRTGRPRLRLATSSTLAAILLALGFSLKIYPGLFVLPLALYVLTGGNVGRARGYDWLGAARVVLAAVLTTLAVQVPFMIAGYEGWRAALTFQGLRQADVTSNSFWYWGWYWLRGGQVDDPGARDAYNSFVGVASPILIALALALAIWLGWRRYRQTGVFEPVATSFAVLAAFMLFHKVHSPQYTLWVLPFFVLLRVPWGAVAAYLVSDFVLDLSIFRLFDAVFGGGPDKWWVITGVNLGVWVHAVLLGYFLLAAWRWPLREPLASFLRTDLPPHGPLTRLAQADARAARGWLGSPTLRGGGITLRPLHITDAQALGAIGAADPELGPWTSGIPSDTASAAAFITAAEHDPARIAFAVIDDASGDLLGTTSFYEADPGNLTTAIGYTFYARAAHGTAVNPAAKLLLLEHAFTVAGAVRVVWHTHENNAHSRAAIAKLGATQEGSLGKHRRFGGGWRTTVQFAMVDDEWPAARIRLEERVAQPAADA